MALLREQVEGELLLKLTASKPREKEGVLRVTVQPFLSGGKRLYQLAYQGEKQVTHRNLSAAELLEELPGLAARYGQLSFRTGKVQYQALSVCRGTVPYPAFTLGNGGTRNGTCGRHYQYRKPLF